MSETNEAYLQASLAWLRARLRELAPRPAPVTAMLVASEPNPEPDRGGWWRGGRPPSPEAPTPTVLLPPAPAILESVEELRAGREAAAEGEPAPFLIALASELGLTPFERDVVLLCAAPELDPRIGSLIAEAQGSSSPTFGLALTVLDDPFWDALSPSRPLRAARLVELGGASLTASPLRLDERVLGLLKGANALDERVARLTAPVPPTPLAPSQRDALERLQAAVYAAQKRGTLPTIQLVGRDPGSKLAVASAAAEAFGTRLLRMDLNALPTAVADLDAFAALWRRETLLLPLALYLDAEDADAASPEARAALARFLGKGPGLAFVGTREPLAKPGGETFDLEVAKPTAEEQRAAWKAATDDADESARLAGGFDLNFADIGRIAAQARDVDGGRPWDAARRFARPRLESLAQRLDAKATWDDLVLPADATAQMRSIVGQVRARHTVYGEWGFGARMNRGMGISALFAGESGTGKTMAAEVIANALEMDLYRIDLASVVSKYIGETEKNLRALFDAAEQGGAILLFDEADALFGKRSEVKDSHDRYANIEVNYLLQRMEAFSGLAILATNMKSALDPAFMRRLRFVVTFPFPALAERRRMWERALPEQTPTEGLDLDRLAKLNATGANIGSIALNAAFLAADAGTPVTMAHLIVAARQEFRKLERPFTEAEFR